MRWLRDLLSPKQTVQDVEWSYDPAPNLEGMFGPIPVDVAIHPSRSGALILLVPGWNGTVEGYEGKYRAMAEGLVTHGVGGVVRTSNLVVGGLAFEATCKHQLRMVAGKARQAAKRICGHPSPELYVVGNSAGGSAAATLASELRVSKLLLIAPSEDAGEAPMREGLAAYEGELHVTVGANDEVVRDFPREVVEWAPRASKAELVVVPDCDHQFRGERNRRNLLQAPLWAFGGEAYPVG